MTKKVQASSRLYFRWRKRNFVRED